MIGLDQLLNYVTIVIIGIFCLWLTRFAQSAKYSMLKTFIRLIFFGDLYYIRWHIKCKVYLLVNALLLLLITTNLTLITLFSHNNILQKPLLTFIVSPFLWVVIFVLVKVTLKPYENK